MASFSPAPPAIAEKPKEKREKSSLAKAQALLCRKTGIRADRRKDALKLEEEVRMFNHRLGEPDVASRTPRVSRKCVLSVALAPKTQIEPALPPLATIEDEAGPAEIGSH